jgi:Fe-Mn family superoxide dismutase
VPDVLSPEGFELAWTQYQATLVEKLNLLTAGKLVAVILY